MQSPLVCRLRRRDWGTNENFRGICLKSADMEDVGSVGCVGLIHRLTLTLTHYVQGRISSGQVGVDDSLAQKLERVLALPSPFGAKGGGEGGSNPPPLFGAKKVEVGGCKLHGDLLQMGKCGGGER